MGLGVLTRRSLFVVLLLVSSMVAVTLACAGGTLVQRTGHMPIVINVGGNSQPGR